MSHMTTYDYRGLPSAQPKKKEQRNSIPARLLMQNGPKRNHCLPQDRPKRKFRNKPEKVDGIKFQSRKEARRYEELLMAEKMGLISELKVHPRFPINLDNWVTPNGQIIGHAHICDYIADFSYLKNGRRVVEDTKGKDPRTGWNTRTEAYKLKKIMMRIINGIDVVEI